MDKEEKILTEHPEGKRGVYILKRRYYVIKDFILKTLKDEGEISFSELTGNAEEELAQSFDGKVIWYMVTVKQDLEARGIIEKFKKKGLQYVKLKSK